MKEPRCIAQLLLNHQATRPMDFTVTHGKGRQGVIIRQTRRPGTLTFNILNRLAALGIFK